MAQGMQARDGSGQVAPNIFEPSGTTQKLTSSGTSAPSSAFSADTIVRIVSDADCHYKIGSGTPVATTSDVFLPSKSGEQILIKSGNKIAVIGNVNLYVTECAV